MVLGSRELTPEEARTAAKEVLANVSLGKDPAASLHRHSSPSRLRLYRRQLPPEPALGGANLRAGGAARGAGRAKLARADNGIEAIVPNELAAIAAKQRSYRVRHEHRAS